MLAAAVALGHVALRPATSSPAESSPKDAELRGRIVCLVEERARDTKSAPPPKHEHAWGFKTADGRLVTLLRTRNSEALFADARLREKELILRGPFNATTGGMEAIVFRSVKGGVAHSLFYWCDICTIRSITPGECVCCREPVELREIPVKDDRL